MALATKIPMKDRSMRGKKRVKQRLRQTIRPRSVNKPRQGIARLIISIQLNKPDDNSAVTKKRYPSNIAVCPAIYFPLRLFFANKRLATRSC
jgi:hypothetical protein